MDYDLMLRESELIVYLAVLGHPKAVYVRGSSADSLSSQVIDRMPDDVWSAFRLATRDPRFHQISIYCITLADGTLRWYILAEGQGLKKEDDCIILVHPEEKTVHREILLQARSLLRRDTAWGWLGKLIHEKTYKSDISKRDLLRAIVKIEAILRKEDAQKLRGLAFRSASGAPEEGEGANPALEPTISDTLSVDGLTPRLISARNS